MEKDTKKKTERASTATIRKSFKIGKITQKMMSFRLDADLAEKLDKEVNKGRLINNLLREHYEKEQA